MRNDNFHIYFRMCTHIGRKSLFPTPIIAEKVLCINQIDMFFTPGKQAAVEKSENFEKLLKSMSKCCIKKQENF